ncbi:MAG: hypothetical protein RL693_558 [Verrucomicrobiota bacterium]|jgi:hypothetical protein
MEELLLILFHVLFEVVLQILIELPFDWFVGMRESKAPQDSRPGQWYFVSILLGGGVGVLSLWVFPNSFIKSSGGRIAYLVFAPLISAGCALLLSRIRVARSKDWINPRLHALCAFWFALVLTIIRFTYVHRQ